MKKYRCCECGEEMEEPPNCLHCGGPIGVGEMVCDDLSHYHYCSVQCFLDDGKATETELEEIEIEEES